jgi:hypothetical protein
MRTSQRDLHDQLLRSRIALAGGAEGAGLAAHVSKAEAAAAETTKAEVRRLKTALRWKIPAAQRQRIQMVLLRESGMTQPAIAAAMGVSLSTVNRAHMAALTQHRAVFSRRTSALPHLTICFPRIRWRKRITAWGRKTAHQEALPPLKISDSSRYGGGRWHRCAA